MPKTRRPYRKKDQLNDRNLPANHEKNKLQPLFAARVDPCEKKEIEAWIKMNNMTKKDATESSFNLAMLLYTPELKKLIDDAKNSVDSQKKLENWVKRVKAIQLQP